VIVEPAGRRVGRAGAAEREAQRLLGPGLADAARYRDDLRLAAFTSCRAESGKASQRVSDPEQRRRSRKLRDFSADYCGGSPALQRSPDKIVSIVIGALQGDEQIAWSEGAGIDRNASSDPIGRA